MENMKMKKEIKDYMHLYINSCECEVIYVNGQVKNHIAKVGETVGFDEVTYYVVSSEDIINVKLILRPLSSMTEEEFKIIVDWPMQATREVTKFYSTDKFICCEYRWPHSSMIDGYGYSSTAIYFTKEEWTPVQFVYLLSKGFDLFNLIHEGLAIEKTEVEKAKTDRV